MSSIDPELESGSRSFEQLVAGDQTGANVHYSGHSALSVVDALITSINPLVDTSSVRQFRPFSFGCAYSGLMQKRNRLHMWQTRRITLKLNGFGLTSTVEYGEDTASRSGFRRGAVYHLRRDTESGILESTNGDTPAVQPSLRANNATSAFFSIEGSCSKTLFNSNADAETSASASNANFQRLQLKSIPGVTPDELVAALAALAWPPRPQQLGSQTSSEVSGAHAAFSLLLSLGRVLAAHHQAFATLYQLEGERAKQFLKEVGSLTSGSALLEEEEGEGQQRRRRRPFLVEVAVLEGEAPGQPSQGATLLGFPPGSVLVPPGVAPGNVFHVPSLPPGMMTAMPQGGDSSNGGGGGGAPLPTNSLHFLHESRDASGNIAVSESGAGGGGGGHGSSIGGDGGSTSDGGGPPPTNIRNMCRICGIGFPTAAKLYSHEGRNACRPATEPTVPTDANANASHEHNNLGIPLDVLALLERAEANRMLEPEAGRVMRENLRSGRFSPAQYRQLFKPRLATLQRQLSEGALAEQEEQQEQEQGGGGGGGRGNGVVGEGGGGGGGSGGSGGSFDLGFTRIRSIFVRANPHTVSPTATSAIADWANSFSDGSADGGSDGEMGVLPSPDESRRIGDSLRALADTPDEELLSLLAGTPDEELLSLLAGTPDEELLSAAAADSSSSAADNNGSSSQAASTITAAAAALALGGDSPQWTAAAAAVEAAAAAMAEEKRAAAAETAAAETAAAEAAAAVAAAEEEEEEEEALAAVALAEALEMEALKKKKLPPPLPKAFVRELGPSGEIVWVEVDDPSVNNGTKAAAGQERGFEEEEGGAPLLTAGLPPGTVVSNYGTETMRMEQVIDRRPSNDVVEWVSTAPLIGPFSGTLTVNWHDQGWGNQKGRLYARRLNDNDSGSDKWVSLTPKPAPHSAATRLKVALPSSLCGSSNPPTRLKLGYLVGGGNGHTLTIRNGAELTLTGTRDVSQAMPSSSSSPPPSSSSSSSGDSTAAAAAEPARVQFPLPATARPGHVLTVAVPRDINPSGLIKVRVPPGAQPGSTLEFVVPRTPPLLPAPSPASAQSPQTSSYSDDGDEGSGSYREISAAVPSNTRAGQVIEIPVPITRERTRLTHATARVTLPPDFPQGCGFVPGGKPGHLLTVRVPTFLGDVPSTSDQLALEQRQLAGRGRGARGSSVHVGGSGKPFNKNGKQTARQHKSRSGAWRRQQLEERLAVLRVPWDQGHVTITVDRKDFLTTALDAVPRDPSEWRKVWRFKFKGEPARDAGGVAREFWSLLSEQLFHPHAGLFMYSATDNLCYQINPLAPAMHGQAVAARMFRVVGRFLGKCLLDRQLMTVSLNRPLLKHLLALPVCFDDLEQVDAALHQNLKWMLENDGVECLCQSFTATEDEFGCVKEVPLCEGGQDMDVTDSNKHLFVQARFKHAMMDRVSVCLGELLNGVYEVVPQLTLQGSVYRTDDEDEFERRLDAMELEVLLCGSPEVDVEDWKKHTSYANGLSGSSRRVALFWRVVEESLDTDQRTRLLQFVTGTSRLPAGGFANLQGVDGSNRKFELYGLKGGNDTVPRSHTCFNRLDLPDYSTVEHMRFVLTNLVEGDVGGFSID